MREFKKNRRSKDWHERRSAYRAMKECDTEKGVETLLASAVKEKNAAVTLEAIKVLGALNSEEAQAALARQVVKAKGRKATLILMALAHQPGSAGTGALSEILRGADSQRAALAALALGAKAQEYSLEDLLAALDHPDWQVVSAAARGITEMARSTRPKGKSSSKALPKWFPKEEVLRSLVRRLEVAQGVERGDLIHALETITKESYGWNLEAWGKVANGKTPDAATLRRRKYPPQMFGIPLYGRRISIVVDATVHIDNAHPFKSRERLQEVCQVPGGREVSWFRIDTVEDFSREHVVRGIRDMPTTDMKFELLFASLKPKHVFGKLVTANTGNKDKAIGYMSKVKHSNGNEVMVVLNRALDVSGKKDAVAWQKGPDSVVFVCSSNPWLGEENDQEVLGAAIGLKAGARMVQIESIGVYQHAHVMLPLFAELSGGHYLDLEK